MTADPTVAARVPQALRADLERLAAERPLGEPVHGRPSMTPHLVRALRQYVDRELHGHDNGTAERVFAPAEGASHRGDPATSRQAARDTAPRTGTARRRALGYIVDAGEHGRTADELLRLEEAAGRKPAGNGPARRVSELKAAGAVMPKLERDEFGAWTPATRPTRTGSEATVYVATAKGAEWLRQAGA